MVASVSQLLVVQLWDTDLPIILNAGFPAGLGPDAGGASVAGDLSAISEALIVEQPRTSLLFKLFKHC